MAKKVAKRAASAKKSAKKTTDYDSDFCDIIRQHCDPSHPDYAPARAKELRKLFPQCFKK
jgi:hypothetical protein